MQPIVILSQALDLVREEKAAVQQEREAFDAFRQRIEAIESISHETTRTDIAAPEATHITEPPVIEQRDPNLEMVMELYGETVGETPDFDEAYQESLQDHFRAEFGTPIAEELATTDVLTQPIKEMVLTAATAARDKRSELLETVANEEQSLQACRDQLSEVAESINIDSSTIIEWDQDRIEQTNRTLSSLESTCDGVANDRQHWVSTLQDRSGADGPIQEPMIHYLYDPMPVTYPVLAAVGEYTDQINNLRRELDAVQSDPDTLRQ